MSGNPDKPKGDGIDRRTFAIGAVSASATVSVLGITELLAQEHRHPLDLLHQITDKSSAQALEERQAKQYESDRDNVKITDGKIQEFYGIKRSDVENLPGTHPVPDIYGDLEWTDQRTGVKYSCCHGNDCRPAIIRAIGEQGFAVGVNFFGHVLFFKLLPSQVKIFSSDGLRPINEPFHKYKTHMCIVGGSPRCIVVPPQG